MFGAHHGCMSSLTTREACPADFVAWARMGELQRHGPDGWTECRLEGDRLSPGIYRRKPGPNGEQTDFYTVAPTRPEPVALDYARVELRTLARMVADDAVARNTRCELTAADFLPPPRVGRPVEVDMTALALSRFHPLLQELCRKHGTLDPHTARACERTGKRPSEISRAERMASKKANFMLIYGFNRGGFLPGKDRGEK